MVQPRKQFRAIGRVVNLPADPDAVEGLLRDYALQRETPTEEDLVEKERLVEELLSCLAVRERDIVVARAMEGFSFREIGELQGLSHQYVRRVYLRALAKMRGEEPPTFNYTRAKRNRVIDINRDSH